MKINTTEFIKLGHITSYKNNLKETETLVKLGINLSARCIKKVYL